MSKANRYTFKAVPGHDGQVERQNITGEFALWRAYEDLENEAKALREEVAAYRADPSYDMACATIRRLNEELAALRARVVVVPPLDHHDDKFAEGWNSCIDEIADLNGKVVSEDALRVLVGHATGEIKHLNNGMCPDDLEGHDTRDPDCAVCRALIDAGKENGDA